MQEHSVTTQPAPAPSASAMARAAATPATPDVGLAPVPAFEHAQTRTKILWSVSNHTLRNQGPEITAARLAEFGLDAARVTYTSDSGPQLRKLRAALTAEMDRRGTHSAPEGWCPFVVSPVGRRAHLFVPSGTQNVEAGETFELLLRAEESACLGDPRAFTGSVPEVCVTSADMLAGLKQGSRIIVSYLQTELHVDSISREGSTARARVTVVDAATLLSGMDIHSPDMPRDMFPLTPADAAAFESRFDDLADYVILAGVRTADELTKLHSTLVGDATGISKRHPTVAVKEHMRQRTAHVSPRLLLKVDSREALDLLPAVFDEIDGIVLSRSELGLSLPLFELPIVQKKLIAECNHRAKVVIVASELMYSMRVNPNPTRAEVSDMANAAADGADALFLAEEVTEGPYAELVAAVSKETLANSEHLLESNWHRVPFEIKNDDDAVAYGALKVAEHSKVKAIVCLTEGGYTALRLSSLRTPAEVIAVTYNYNVMRQLSLMRSVTVLTLHAAPAFDQVLEETKKLLGRYCAFERGEKFVFVSLTASPIAARNSNLFTLQEVD